jgi:uncharacterized protein (TIGR00661 family)
MDIIYSICSWGFGHATRSLPVLRKLIKEDHTITVISHGRTLKLLQKELDDAVSYRDIPDYPMLISKNTEQFVAKSMIYWPYFIKRMESSLQQLKKILETTPCDRIISDGRYDMYSKSIPSVFISHQMRIMNPLRFKPFERGSETFNLFFFKRFRDIIVPDYKDNNLTGDLSHNLQKIDESKIHYVGLLSDFAKKDLTKDIDYFFSISGPEPQRSYLEQAIMDQIEDIDGQIVLTLGKTEEQSTPQLDNVQIYPYLPKEKREDILNRSKLVISRSGYSTIMDLAVIGTKALMIPTPGQIEQQYLAAYLSGKNLCHQVSQKSLNLERDTALAQKKKGFFSNGSVETTVNNILDIILN